MANKAQLIASSSQTYYDNTGGNITPNSVNAFNTTWINSSVLNDNTASLMVTASAQASTITFTNGDGSTYLVQIAQSGSSVSASYAIFAETARSSSLASSASFTPNAITTVQPGITSASIGFLTGNGNTTTITVNNVTSASYADKANTANSAATASFLLGTVASASYALNADLLDGIDSTGYAKTGSNTFKGPNTFEDGVVLNNITAQAAGVDGGNINLFPYIGGNVVLHDDQVVSGSITIKDQLTGNQVVLTSDNTPNTLAVNGNIQSNSGFGFIGNGSQLTAVTSSFVNTLNQAVTISGSLGVTGTTTLTNATMSNVMVTGTASVAFLNVTFQSSSIIYASGSNQLGDAPDDTQTLWGTVNVISGPLVVTGSSNFNGTQTITGSINVSGSIRISQGDDLITHHVQAAAVNGVEIQNNTGNVVALFGAGGGLGSTFYGQINGTAFSGSGAQIFGVVSSSFATTASFAQTSPSEFPFTGSAGISGSLNLVGALYIPSGSFEITGSATINSGSLVMFSYKTGTPSNRSFEALVTQSLNSTNNIISIVANSANTGSIIISGSGNYVSVSALALNTQNQQGATVGFSGTNAYVTILPTVTGSNPNYNTDADRNSRRVAQITNSNSNATITITDNRASETSAPFGLSQTSNNMSVNVTLNSGSLSISNSALIGSSTTFLVSGSGTAASNTSISNSIISTAGGTIIAFNATSSGAATISNSIFVGGNLRVNLTGSSSQNSTTTTTPALNDSVIIGRHLVVTGSSASATTTANIAVFGGFNTADGLLNDGRFTRFAIGTGTDDGTRRTSFHVSASGMTTVNAGLNVRGVQTGETELEVRATGVKIGNLLADSHNLTGSFSITGSQTITGSLVGQPISQSVSSNTASLNLATGNFFNLTLPASTNTYITASGQIPGQTINLKITQQATTGSVTFGSGIKQVSGSAYTATTTANAVDIVTFISFDETGLYLSNVKNLV
jgi:hypothetical protein